MNAKNSMRNFNMRVVERGDGSPNVEVVCEDEDEESGSGLVEISLDGNNMQSTGVL